MPKPLRSVLIWSQEHEQYELQAQEHAVEWFGPGDEAAFSRWLETHTSFAFVGQAGRLSVLKEARPRGAGYWYAYRKQGRQTRKRYLGRTDQVTFVRLEQEANVLTNQLEPSSFLPEPGTLSPELQGIVLSSKLAIPRLPTSLVERERLLSVLDGTLSTRLSLVSAPAGFGKTTLLSAWASRRKSQVVWLSLDDLDNTPTRFWVALIAALRRCPGLTPGFGETAVAQLQSPQPPLLSACLSVLLHELEGRSAHPAPLVLILDDYQVIEDPVIHQSLAFFLEHLPAHLHLVLSSRVDPDLPLARLRARGQLAEIRADELRFQEDEASQYLGRLLSSTLLPEEVRQLVSRTEGWITGLHLAALTLQKHEDRAAFLQAFTGGQRYLLDYVQEEILARLPERMRDFLLHTAILSRLDASMCQAVTASPERRTSQQMLVFLERANLFLVPLDEERRTYRLHDLFREALLAHLHTSHPELVPLLHRRAARFYEEEGQWAEAITHRLEARDYSTAARLMEQTVEQFWLRGEAETMARWVLALPQLLVREHARLVLTTALYLLNTVMQTTQMQRERVHREVRQLMGRVETALHPQANETNQEILATGAGTAFGSESLEARAAEEALLYRRLRLLHAGMVLYEARAASEYERLSTLHQHMQELDQDEEVIWQLLPLSCNFMFHYVVRQEGARLVPQMLEAKQRMIRSGSPFVATRVRQWLAFSAMEAGQLRLAYEESLAALDLIEQIAGYALLKSYAEIALAYVFSQWNRLEEARGRLRMVIQDAATWQNSDLLLRGSIDLMQVELARGDLSAVEQELQGFEQLEDYQGYADYWRWLPAIRAQWWLAQGQVKKASDWALGVVFRGEPWERSVYHAFVVVMRVYFAQRSFREALSLLERFRSHLDRPTNIRITLTYLAQLLVALHWTGQSKQAHEIAARLFALTEPEGYLRVYLDEGEPMREVLEALLTLHSQQYEFAASTTAYLAKLLASFEQEEPGVSRSKDATKTPVPSRVQQPSPPAPTPVASLTRRELEVLRLLAAGASNQDIAQTLVISLDTVKKHVRNLLSKLGASRRTQAVAQARARSLL